MTKPRRAPSRPYPELGAGAVWPLELVRSSLAPRCSASAGGRELEAASRIPAPVGRELDIVAGAARFWREDPDVADNWSALMTHGERVWARYVRGTAL